MKPSSAPQTPAQEPLPLPPGYYLPLTTDPTTPGILAGGDHGPTLELKADVCVIGSGAGGAVVAAGLAERGAKVVLIEEGDYLRGNQFNQREDQMLRVCLLRRLGVESLEAPRGLCCPGIRLKVILDRLWAY